MLLVHTRIPHVPHPWAPNVHKGAGENPGEELGTELWHCVRPPPIPARSTDYSCEQQTAGMDGDLHSRTAHGRELTRASLARADIRAS